MWLSPQRDAEPVTNKFFGSRLKSFQKSCKNKQETMVSKTISIPRLRPGWHRLRSGCVVGDNRITHYSLANPDVAHIINV